MLRFRSFIEKLSGLLVVMVLLSGSVLAAKSQAAADDPPVRLPSREASPKWKNLAQLQH